jgi:septum formation protein
VTDAVASLWREPAPLLLASTSPTRRALLAAVAIPVEAEAPGVDERAVEALPELAGAASELLAQRLAAEKALAVSRRRPDRLVLGADQVLDLDGEILHTPPDREAARAQIGRLQGRAHRLTAAAVLARGGSLLAAVSDETRLTMRALDDDAVALYLALAGDAATRSVGAYQIESLGLHLFERVEGQHATILGLPLLELLAVLRRLGVLGL